MAHDDDHAESDCSGPTEEWDGIETSVIGRKASRDQDPDERPASDESTVPDDGFVPL